MNLLVVGESFNIISHLGLYYLDICGYFDVILDDFG